MTQYFLNLWKIWVEILACYTNKTPSRFYPGGFVTLTGDREIRSVSRRLPDNPGELAWVLTLLTYTTCFALFFFFYVDFMYYSYFFSYSSSVCWHSTISNCVREKDHWSSNGLGLYLYKKLGAASDFKPSLALKTTLFGWCFVTHYNANVVYTRLQKRWDPTDLWIVFKNWPLLANLTL